MKVQKRNDFLSRQDTIDLNEIASSISEFYFPMGRIEPEILARKNNITFSYGEYSDAFDGLLECEDRSFHIYLNTDRLKHAYSDRARFTFGHELGHYYIDDHRNALLRGNSPSHSSFTGFVSKNRAERQADYFASCLLLPENRFKDFCRRKKFNFNVIQDLARFFGISISATALRFCAVGNHPIMVVCSYKNEIKWYWSSEDFPFKKLIFGKDKVPTNSVAGEFFQMGRKPKGTERIFAMDWFDIWKDSQAGLPFYEHCMCAGNYALSIIWED